VGWFQTFVLVDYCNDVVSTLGYPYIGTSPLQLEPGNYSFLHVEEVRYRYIGGC
jgi:hypothetical protein